MKLDGMKFCGPNERLVHREGELPQSKCFMYCSWQGREPLTYYSTNNYTFMGVKDRRVESLITVTQAAILLSFSRLSMSSSTDCYRKQKSLLQACNYSNITPAANAVVKRRGLLHNIPFSGQKSNYRLTRMKRFIFSASDSINKAISHEVISEALLLK